MDDATVTGAGMPPLLEESLLARHISAHIQCNNLRIRLLTNNDGVCVVRQPDHGPI